MESKCLRQYTGIGDARNAESASSLSELLGWSESKRPRPYSGVGDARNVESVFPHYLKVMCEAR